LVLERRPVDSPKRQTLLTNLEALRVGVRDAAAGELSSFREGQKKSRAEEVREAALGAAREQQVRLVQKSVRPRCRLNKMLY
jgi:hypothetical protein